MSALGIPPLDGPPRFEDLHEVERYLDELARAIGARVVQVWDAQDEVPTSPWEGLTGVATYSPSSGNGIYMYANGGWVKLTTGTAGTFPT